MGRGATKSERLREMERLYLQRAYSDMEMAARLGVTRSTVHRYRTELEQTMPFMEEGTGSWRLDRGRYISNMRVNLPEALSLYLSARRTLQQTCFAQTHVANALGKLALVLRQPMTSRLMQAAEEISSQRIDPTQAAIFETIATAWIESRQVRITYRSLWQESERVHRFSPYLLEPYTWTDGIYLIGHSELVNQVLTLRMDRIVHVQLLGPFTLPSDFDEEKLLRHAWGIWFGEGKPQMVRLKFEAGATVRRLKESMWHPLEKLTDLPDGSCIWEAPIADWQEMLPWIRGWGVRLEVLEPSALRMEMVEESRAFAKLYGWRVRRPLMMTVPSPDESFGEFFRGDK
jgi:CRISPR-associated endonuclease/helicase Cas3